ncbi:MAG TPA: hypothetical protein VFV90_00045, partial [Usitatibacter sp.]|nr:hypothetical protein [Usitatibacter sp.]
MPKYVVKPEQDYPMTAAESSPKKKAKRYPSVTIPVSKEIIAALEVDGAVEVTLKGKVVGLESRASSDPSPWGNRDEMRVELRVVEAYPDDGADNEEGEEESEPTMKDAI